MLDTTYYSYGQKGTAHNHYNSLLWTLNGLIHSFIVVVGLKCTLPETVTSFGAVIAFTLALVINLRLFYHETDNKNFFSTALTMCATLLYPLYIHYVEGLFYPFFYELPLWIGHVLAIVLLCFLVTNVFVLLLRRASNLNGTLKYWPKTKVFKFGL